MNRIATHDRAMQAQLDRLVGGDLSESERTTLLAWLDEDAARWRACGLAFLEAQMWQEAAAIAPSASPAQPAARITAPATLPQQAPQPSRASTGRDGWRVSSLALTAAVALAFLSGILLARWLPTSTSRQMPSVAEHPTSPLATAAAKQLIATVPVKTNLDTPGPFLLQLPVSTEPGAELAAVGSSISAYDRQRWERRGFEVVEELRYLPARLPDGRQIMVPVNKIQLKFKGTPVS